MSRWTRMSLLCGVCSGLCLCGLANTSAAGQSLATAAAPATPAAQMVQNDVALPPPESFLPGRPATHVALLLPLGSETLGEAADALRAGFMAAYEHEPQDMEVNVVETGDSSQEVLSDYVAASMNHDIVVGPLSRAAVAAVAQSDAVGKPTIALTPPEEQEGAEVVLPRQMLIMGLSIEDEARQAAGWAAADRNLKKAFIIHTSVPWQRRAAKAFETQWQRLGREAEAVEVVANDGFLAGRVLLQLKKQIADDKSALLFAALDARQARQLRAVMGGGIPMYGTSQLNAADGNDAEHTNDMNGAHLLDIPWRLQPDHPAVMAYPPFAAKDKRQRGADMERLYALGIDAYRVAREIAAKRDDFQLDGVTGTLKIHFTQAGTQFERTEQQATYRDGSAVADTGLQ